MQEKETNELEKVLGKIHPEEYGTYIKENKDSMLSDATSFCAYIKDIMKKNGITQQIAFLKADIPERYGYKLLSGEKHTRQRDVIIRICYAAELTLQQTQMIAFNERPGSIIEVNTLLKTNNLEPLRTSGIQE